MCIDHTTLGQQTDQEIDQHIGQSQYTPSSSKGSIKC